ncbi:MAG: metallophosphoesterase [Clostridia bacterium]|nr:metallophosphoesterase [Clostridia bacterium]
MNRTESTILRYDDNIEELRAKYPDGLHFVVGDTHGQAETLRLLMEKIRFDPQKDHVFFIGDYNGGGRTDYLLSYIAEYYSENVDDPGFHLIRGNHERELCPWYSLENLPDIMVLRGKVLDYYLVHSGMISSAMKLISRDMAENPGKKAYSYKLDENSTSYHSPLKLIVWSRNGLYSRRIRRWWPTEEELSENRACIIHGHAPYCFFMHEDYISYGDNCLFWQKQHIFFSESLQSFNIDSNVKGRYKNNETYRGLSCVCIEVIEEIAAQNEGKLTFDGVRSAENFVFSEEHTPVVMPTCGADIARILSARPEMKTISVDCDWNPYFKD